MAELYSMHMLDYLYLFDGNVSVIWLGVVFGVRSYLPWKTLKRRRDAEYNSYFNAYLYWLLPPVFSHIWTII
jgi:hypothetical protein